MNIEIDLDEFPELDGCMSAEDYAALWDYARLRTKSEMVGLLAFGEMQDRSVNPLTSFSVAMLNWLDDAREAIREEAESGISGDSPSRSVH